jgi:hypothetical protein
MTTDNKLNPSTGASTFPPSPRPTAPGASGNKGDQKIDQTANRLAHKGAKKEQEFDKENNTLISK